VLVSAAAPGRIGAVAQRQHGRFVGQEAGAFEVVGSLADIPFGGADGDAMEEFPRGSDRGFAVTACTSIPIFPAGIRSLAFAAVFSAPSEPEHCLTPSAVNHPLVRYL
jgi:hypothetical protein